MGQVTPASVRTGQWLLLALASYMLLYTLGWVLRGQYYTVDWLTPRLWLLALVTLAVAFRGGRAMVWSVLGVVVGAAVGEVVGGSIFERQSARLAAERAAAGAEFAQEWEPLHPGWWIALLIFAVMSVVGLLVHAVSGAGHWRGMP